MRISAAACCSVALMIGALYCGSGAPHDSRRDASVVRANGEMREGWSCSPEFGRPFQNCPNGAAREYLYLSFAVRGSPAMRSRHGAEAACRREARRQIMGDSLAGIMAEHIEQTTGLTDGQSLGIALLIQGPGLQRNESDARGIYDCCSLSQETGRCARPTAGETENWQECLCTGYLRFPGGRQAFEAELQALAE